MWIKQTFIIAPTAVLTSMLGACGGEPELDSTEREYILVSTGEVPGSDPPGERCDLIDSWEPNPSAKQPTPMFWHYLDLDGATSLGNEAYLCASEEDWYLFQTEKFGAKEPTIVIWALVQGSGLCGSACGEPYLPSSPENTITVEVYHAGTSELLFTQTSDNGTVRFEQSGDYGHDLLIRVLSPTPHAAYPYALSAIYHDGPTGDICEC